MRMRAPAPAAHPRVRQTLVGLTELRSKAEQGSVVAQSMLGISYLHGYEVERDLSEAFRWLTLAADRGAPRAEAWLGTMYEEGLGVVADFDRARGLYERAARKGEFFACIFLGRLLANGKAGTVDRAGAAHWYGEAAKMDVAPCAELDEARSFVA